MTALAFRDRSPLATTATKRWATGRPSPTKGSSGVQKEPATPPWRAGAGALRFARRLSGRS